MQNPFLPYGDERVFCNVCGNELEEGTNYCPICGAGIDYGSDFDAQNTRQAYDEGQYVQPMGVEQQYIRQAIPQSELPTTRVTVGDYTGSLTSETPTRKFAADETLTKKERKKEEKEQKKLGKENKKRYRVKKSKKKLALKISIVAVFLIGIGIGTFFGIRYLIDRQKEDFRAYFKRPTIADIEPVQNGERAYVKSQLIVEGSEKCTSSKMKDLAEEKNGKIVGMISTVRKYQIEFADKKSKSDLEKIIEEWSRNSLVAQVDYHYAYATEGGSFDFTKDPWWDSNDGDQPADFEVGWDIYNPDGNNWAVESIWAPAVWNPEAVDLGEYGSVKSREYKKVKVGLLDTAFDRKHKDLTDRIQGTDSGDVAAEYAPYAGRYNGNDLTDAEKAEEKRLSHGTFVAGIIGANIGDNFGIAGVAQNADLYAYSIAPEMNYTTVFDWQCQLALMFEEDIRLVNISMQLDMDGIDHPEDAVGELNRSMEDFLTFYLEQDKDFLLVKSAGDGENPKDDLSKDFLLGIKNESVRSRILAVGGAEPLMDSYEKLKGYQRTEKTNFGDRVDIYAPGIRVLSDIPADRVEKRDGTSAAAAFVTSGCALVMGIVPDLSMTEVREIVCNNYIYQVEGTGKPYLNVFLLTEEAGRRVSPDQGETISGEAGHTDQILSAIEKKLTPKKGLVELALDKKTQKEVEDFSKLEVKAVTGKTTETFQFDENGKVQLSLDPGEWNISIHANKFETKQFKQSISAGETYTKNISLKVIDWRKLYWAYIEKEKVLQYYSLAEDYSWWVWPKKILVRDCDLDGIPEIYIRLWNAVLGSEIESEDGMVLTIENGKVVKKTGDFSVGNEGMDLEDAFNEFYNIWLAGWGVAQGPASMTYQPEYMDSVKEYIYKSDFSKSEWDQSDFTQKTGEYKSVEKVNEIKNINVWCYNDTVTVFIERNNDYGIWATGSYDRNTKSVDAVLPAAGVDGMASQMTVHMEDDRIVLQNIYSWGELWRDELTIVKKTD